MINTRLRLPQWLTAFGAPWILLSSACQLDHLRPAEPPVAITISLGFPGGTSDVFLTVGDRDTIRAVAYSGTWPTQTLFDSMREPRRFTYYSSDTSVATVSADGVVVTRGVGTTRLRAVADGADSGPMALTVAPPARALRATPGTLTGAVGDTLAVTVTALDDQGASVRGVVFNIWPDTTVWAVVEEPAEGDWRLETPRTLHFRARQVGTVHLLAASLNERAAARLTAAPVAVTIRAP